MDIFERYGALCGSASPQSDGSAPRSATQALAAEGERALKSLAKPLDTASLLSDAIRATQREREAREAESLALLRKLAGVPAGEVDIEVTPEIPLKKEIAIARLAGELCMKRDAIENIFRRAREKNPWLESCHAGKRGYYFYSKLVIEFKARYSRDTPPDRSTDPATQLMVRSATRR